MGNSSTLSLGRERLKTTVTRIIVTTLIASAVIVDAQKSFTAFGSAQEPAVSDNIRRFQELYGFATQLMNLGGNILNNAQEVTGTSPRAAATRYRNGAENDILGEVRSQLRGIPSVESASYDGASRGGPMKNAASGGLFSGYGGGPLGAGSRGQQRSILDTIMGTFLGSSIDSDASSTPNFFSPTSAGYGDASSRYGNARQGSNIDALVDALSRSGAKRADLESDAGGPTSFLSQFFGGRK